MRINLLSSFAAGILITTAICGTVYFTDNSKVAKASAKPAEIQIHTLSEKEMKEKLAAAGYVIQTKAEYDKSVKDAKTATQKQTPAEDAKSTKAVTKLIVNVSEGMTSIDVGNMLVKAGLVPNAFNFSKDIEKRGLMNKLRPGTFVVDSNMTYDQIVGTIFK
ncbi:endolytic transglycosylase MltG [Neobacillus bataviensis]|uniref:endolytic transglycosylase MltG n=1 Tax=Neobacillus bataviensis TaxID=220685 RepID=UPI001CC13B1B|nr:endolytic transglycosylase MltG [Neobacillus bataviensis]